MGVGVFFENYVVGGGSRYVIDCVSHLISSGRTVTLFSNPEALSQKEIAHLPGPLRHVSVAFFDRTQSVTRIIGKNHLGRILSRCLIFMRPLMFLFNVVNAWRKIGKNKFDMFISFNGGYPASEPSLSVVVASHLRGIKSILVVLSSPQPRRNIIPGYDFVIDFIVFRVVQKIIVNSKMQGDLMVKRRHAPTKKICVVPNGLPERNSRPAFQRLSRGDIVIGTVSRLDPAKGLQHLIRALPILGSQKQLRLRIIGDGEHLTHLKKISKQLGVDSQVHFAGFLEEAELEKEVERFDIYAFPSVWEGFPYGVLEAMRAGLPIVATDVGGIPEAIRHGIDGLLVTPGSASALAKGVGELINNPVRARSFGASARQRYQTNFTSQKMKQAFDAVMVSV